MPPSPGPRPEPAGAFAVPRAAELFPFFVCKLAGRSAACFDDLLATATLEIGEQLQRTEAELAGLAVSTAARLETTGALLHGSALRAKVLDLRRDVQGLRLLDQRKLERLAAVLPLELACSCRRLRALHLRSVELRAAAREAFTAERLEIRRRFQGFLRFDTDFHGGLLMSSRSLSSQLQRYLATPPGQLRSKEAQVERGLMRYFSRMVMKASPFSTFCGVGMGRIMASPAAPAGPLTLTGNPAHKRVKVRLNKNLRLLAHERLEAHPASRRQLPVELNPTLYRDGRRWVFLALAAGRETLQRLAAAPALEDLVRWFTPGHRASHGACVDRLIESRAAGDRRVAEALVDRLLAIGFLSFAPLTPAYAPEWDLHLRRFLATVVGAEARSLASCLARLGGLARRYQRATLAARPELLDAAEQSIRASLGPRDEGGGQLHGVLFYEDAAATGQLRVARSNLSHLTSCLVEYARLASALAPGREEQAKMRAFFDLTYGAGAPVPILRFFEDYALAYFKDHIERARSSFHPDRRKAAPWFHPVLDDPGAIELLGAALEANRRLNERVTELWRCSPDAEEIGLDEGDFAAALEGVPPPAARPSSISVFGQPLPGYAPDGGLGLVLGIVSAGFGKYFSRFLPLLPRSFTAALRRRYRQVDATVLAEICGDADFNANLHPPLLPFALRYPTSTGAAIPGAMEIRDLEVAPDPSDPRLLRLTHPDHPDPVVPLDLGFENPALRPPLFQLLAAFAPAGAFAFHLPESCSPADGDEVIGIQCRPRIVYRHTLVLARRRWRVAAPDFPHRRAGEGEADYFLRVNAWRQRAGMPREVFVSLLPGPRDDTAAAPPAASREHLYKPQYLDFANPLLVDLLSRLPSPHERFTATFAERLPRREDLLRAEGEPWVAEIVLQLDCNEERRRGAGR
jgi:hypothetical protein